VLTNPIKCYHNGLYIYMEILLTIGLMQQQHSTTTSYLELT